LVKSIAGEITQLSSVKGFVCQDLETIAGVSKIGTPLPADILKVSHQLSP